MHLLRSIVCALPLAAVPVVAFAQAQPGKPIRMVIGFPPGGPIDTTARILVPQLVESLGQQVIVDNRAGAS